MADVVVVGAGIAGVACARELRAAGIDVRLVDRGHVPGGRMASRELWGRRVDLGASYFTVSDAGFRAVVDDWAARGLAREWTDTFTALGEDEPLAKSGPVRWGAPAGLRSLVEDLAADLEVERQEVASLADLDAPMVVLAMPDPQARRLTGDHPVTAVLDREWEPVIAVAARWPERTWDGISPTSRFDGAFVNDDPAVAWIADDGRRRGDDAPVLVAHSTPQLAARHLAEPGGSRPGDRGGSTPSAAPRRAHGPARPPVDLRAPGGRSGGPLRRGRRPRRPGRRVRRRLGRVAEGRDGLALGRPARTRARRSAQRGLKPEHITRRCSIRSVPR